MPRWCGTLRELPRPSKGGRSGGRDERADARCARAEVERRVDHVRIQADLVSPLKSASERSDVDLRKRLRVAQRRERPGEGGGEVDVTDFAV